jgi:hypothetical protein
MHKKNFFPNKSLLIAASFFCKQLFEEKACGN